MIISEKIKTFIMAGVLAVAGIGAVVATDSVYAVSDYDACMAAAGNDPIAIAKCSTEAPATTPTAEEVVQRIINTMLYIVGILAVVMVIYGGVQYTTSAGDAGKVTKAKNTILYGLIGLIVAVLAYAIVGFVIDRL